MQQILFTKKECKKILDGIKNSRAGGTDDVWYRKYQEFLILDREILDLVLEKVKIFGVKQIKQGRILKYEKGCFFNIHTDTYDEKPHRYKTIIIQLSDENEYEGGKVIVGDEVLSKHIGNTTIFDSTTLHGMEIIENGTRYSFIVWLERSDVGVYKNII